MPQRTCIGCRGLQGKRQMVRIVRAPDGRVAVDPTGKRPGRGAYVHAVRECVEAALRGGRLAKALKTEVTSDVAAALRQDLEHALARAELLEKLAAERAAGGALPPPGRPGGGG